MLVLSVIYFLNLNVTFAVNTILNLSDNKVTNLRQKINEPVISWSVYKTRPRLVFPFFHKHFMVVVSIAVKHSFSCLN